MWDLSRLLGWLASIIVKTDAQPGAVANVLVGVIGSALGVWIADLVVISATGGIARFGIAIAVLLNFILGKVGFFTKS